eukprot:4129199-Amphidinium_carterae.2
MAVCGLACHVSVRVRLDFEGVCVRACKGTCFHGGDGYGDASMLRRTMYLFMSLNGLVCHGFGGASGDIEDECVRAYSGNYLH